MLITLPPRHVQLLFSEGVRDCIAELEIAPDEIPPGERWIVRTWNHLRGVSSIVNDVIESLAEVAGSLLNAPTEPVAAQLSRTDGRSFRELSPWTQAAERLVHAGRLPLPEGFANSVHAAQLARQLAPKQLRLILACADNAPPEGALLSLARAAQWFADNTSASVAVLIPKSLESSVELDSIRHGSLDVILLELLPEEADTPARTEDRDRLFVRPFIGVPHPASPGEQLLAERLREDSELAGLFAFNVPVETRQGSRYIADLLWKAGQLVVEVDGYRWHSSRTVFVSDRNRDYELLINGYAVLRLPHDEVINCIDNSLEKIRRVVTWKRSCL
jgi:very-short-patch-repair endonuclease